MALEDAPRSSKDHTTETTEVTPASGRARETFIESWQRRLRERVAESPLAGWLDQDDDDEKKDNSTDDATEVSPAKNRFQRLRGGLRGLLVPKPDTIETGHESVPEPEVTTSPEVPDSRSDASELYETWSPQAVAEILEAPASHESAETPIELDNDYHELDLHEPDEFIPLESEGNIPLEPVSSTESSARPEPESLQTILERQHNIQTSAPEAVVINNINHESVNNSTTVNNYESGNNTGALLAVDMLNYGLARHRDTKKEKAAIVRENKVNKASVKRDSELTKRLDQQKLYQEELQKRATKLEKQQPDRLPKIRQADRRPGPEIAPKSQLNVDRITSVSNERNAVNRLEARPPIPEALLASSERHIVATPDIALPSVETVMSKVEKAAEYNIPIETEYELRHERKGNTDFQATESGTGSPIVNALDQSASNYPIMGDANNVSTNNSPKLSLGSDNDYKQAVATGAWGAAVGILLFVIFIILTR